MRNLKKILALVLALMMTLSLMVTASAAYNDQDDIKYPEAVDVMTAIGVFNGTGDGNFDPNRILTRAEAAKLIAYMLLTEDVAEKLGTPTAPFTDVPAGEWYSGAVAYCASRGIISGYEGKFSPFVTLDGYSFGKMLLLAAGVGQSSDYEGANWQVNVATAVVTNELDKGITGLILSNPVDRQTAAQMAFNALNHGKPVVTTSTKYVVTSTTETVDPDLFDAAATSANKVGDGVTFATVLGTVNGRPYDDFIQARNAGTSVVLGYDAAATNANAVYAKYGVNFTVDPMTVTDTVYEGSIAQTVYDNLHATIIADAFGNPSAAWFTDASSQPLVVTEQTPDLEFTSNVTCGMLYTALKLNPTSASRLTVTTVVDGFTTEADSSVMDNLGSGDPTVFAYNGALTKVYWTDRNAITITVVNTYEGTIAYVAEQKNPDGQVTTQEGVNVTAATKAPGTLGNSGKFNTHDFVPADAGKTVIYTAAYNDRTTNYDLVSVKFPTTITTVATRQNGSGATSTVLAGGNTYSFNYQAAAYTVGLGTEVVLYLDNYGNIIGTDTPEAAALNYAVILGLGANAASGEGTLSVSGSQQAMLLLPDATTVTVTINPQITAEYKWDATANSGAGAWQLDGVGYADKEDALNWTNGDTASATKHPELAAAGPALYDVVTYTVNNKGEYNVTLVNKTAASIDNGTAGKITTNVPAIATGVVANSKTIFLVKAPGTNAAAYNVYTGIANVPSLESITGSNNRIVAADGVAKLVFLNTGDVVGSSSTTKDLVFITSVGKQTDSVWTEATGTSTIYIYNAVVNGQVTTITSSVSNIATGLYDSMTIDADNVVTGVHAADALTNGTGKLAVTDVDGNAANGIVTFTGTNAGTYSYNEATVVYAVAADGSISVSSVNALRNDVAIQAAYVVDNVLTAVYYTAT